MKGAGRIRPAAQDMNSIASAIDHTLLRPTATAADIEQLCREARHWNFASVCLAPVHVALAAGLLQDSRVAVGTVVGFPCGYDLPETKAFAARSALAAGATEIDMVIHLGAALEGRLASIHADITAVEAAVPGALVKVIIECCYLTDDQKTVLTETVVAAGAAYVKTSTGFAPGGATPADVALLHRVAAGRISVKAAGGIRDLAAARAMLAAGASRLGTSSGVAIVQAESRLRKGTPA